LEWTQATEKITTHTEHQEFIHILKRKEFILYACPQKLQSKNQNTYTNSKQESKHG